MQFDDAPAAEPKPVKGQTYRKVRAQSHRSAHRGGQRGCQANRSVCIRSDPLRLIPPVALFLLTVAVLHAVDY